MVHNPAARTLLGLDPPLEQLDAWPDDHERLRPDGAPFPQAELPLVRALAGESVTGVDLLVRNNANPQGRALCVSAHPLAGPLGQHRAVAAFHDVSNQRRTEAELGMPAATSYSCRSPTGWSAACAPATRLRGLEVTSSRSCAPTWISSTSSGLLPPAEFLAAAEASPLMIAIGRRALEKSCRMAAVWAELLGPDAPDVHVNVSGRQLEAGNLTGDVLAALRRYSLPATRLVLELTELPVDILKIDLRFVAGVGIDPSCNAVIRAILSIGQALGLTVVAEGVQTPVQADQLARYGCDTAQGCLYSPPRPEQDLLLHLRAQVPGTRQVQPPRPT